MPRSPEPLPVALSGQYVCVGEGLVHTVSLTEGRTPSYRQCSITTDATSIISFGSSILAFGDGALACDLGAGLDTMRHVDLAGASRCLTAQPKVDPITGELHLLTFSSDPSQLHVTVSPGGLTRTIRAIDNAPSRIRRLGLTRDDVVLLADGFVGVTGRTGTDADPTWFAIDTEARDLATVHANGETVVVCTTGPSLVQWTLHRRVRTVQCQVLDVAPHEFAMSNGRPSDAPHRFLWTVGSGAAHKHDLLTGTRRSHDFGGGRQPGELVFIADPDRIRAEDGGWLAGFVHDATRNETDFVVLDAREIERPAVAVVRIPRRIPGDARGAWIPTAQI